MKKIFVIWIAAACLILTGSCQKNADSLPPAETRASPADTPTAGSSSISGGGELPYRIETAASGLNVPWDMDMADDGRIFLTERAGTVRVIVDGALLQEPVLSLTDRLSAKGEGGLLGLVLDPDFARNHLIYVYQTYTDEAGETANRIVRLKEMDNKAQIDGVLIEGLPGAANHNGGRIKIGTDRKLYATVGEIYEPGLAQDVKSLGGKLLRLNLDGSVPADNPFPGSPVYTLGHRNPQGLAWQPGTGRMFSAEHGQSAHDEINGIEAGANYGWPLIQGDAAKAGMKTPLINSGEETWAPSGLAYVTKGPWKDSLVAAGLRGNRLYRFALSADGAKITAVKEWLVGDYGRLRNVYEGPDGVLYVMTNNRDGRGKPQAGDDRLLRLVP